ncbi:hypothetical protein [Azospirillum argentinense]|uniref:Uncharacterized protein n=1 Tax=Azospirillum brasilense TaxID=192 RepID=A0A4D8Q5Q9_AZOBR|nr:hypothetical protein [Azospirillum argentinense]QCO05464.1 hypothetical protein D3867_26325 [Azospirillum argentinense]
MNNRAARLQKHQRQERALRQIADAHRAGWMAKLRESAEGNALLTLLDDLPSRPVAGWPDILAPLDWLRGASAEFRWIATRLIGEAHDRQLLAAGEEPLDDPLPWDAESPWMLIRRLINERRTPVAQIPNPLKPKWNLMLNIAINGPDDVPVLHATINALAGLMNGAAPVALAPAPALPAPSAENDGADAPKRRGRPPKATTETAEPAAAPTAEAAPEAALDAPAVQPDPAPQPAPAPAPADVAFTQEQVMAALQNYARTKGPVALQTLMQQIGAKRASEIPAEKFAEVMAKVGANG